MRIEIQESYSTQSYVVGIIKSIVLFLVSELFGNDMPTGSGNLKKFTLNVWKVQFQTDYFDLYCIFINDVLHSVFS
jgi:hypothetical protein